MEAHVIVHSVFCFTLLCVCVLHSLCVCLEGHFALLHTPRFQWGPPLSAGDPIISPLPIARRGGAVGSTHRAEHPEKEATHPE